MPKHSGYDVWEAGSQTYTESQVESVLNHCEIEIVNDTAVVFMAYCPFHGNTDSPAFAVNKENGLFICFNPSCEVSGTLEDLLRRIKGLNPFQAQRLISKSRNDDATSFSERLDKIRNAEAELKEFSQSKLDELYENFNGSPAQTYMRGRGFTDETLDYFRVGYSPAKTYPSPRPEMVIVPMHDIKGMPIGLIGRSIEGKEFKNSRKLPKRRTAWNIHRAKREGETVIIVEASFDAMRVHQAGYPNVIALLGGHVSDFHIDQIERHFTRIIIMTDFDRKPIRYPNCRQCGGNCQGHLPGRDLGRKIVSKLSYRRVFWAAYDDSCVYPHEAKDASDMTDDEIRQCLKNAVTNYEYRNWNIESLALAS